MTQIRFCLCEEKMIILTLSPATLGKRFSAGTGTSSIWIMPVTEARSENLPSILGVESPLKLLSTMKPLISPSSHLAQTIHTSAIGEFVILKIRVYIKEINLYERTNQVLLPVSMYVLVLLLNLALVSMPAGSLP